MIVERYILMADVVSSRNLAPMSLAEDLKRIVNETNSKLGNLILSPLSVTLGDEFQGLCDSLDATIQVVLHLEREILRNNRAFSLRYVIQEGKIETTINTDISYGMLGEGLTIARNTLNNKSQNRATVQCHLKDRKRQLLLNYVFNIFTNVWNLPSAKKHPKILELLLFEQLSDKDIAKQTGKKRSEIWKFRRNWQMSTYVSALNILREKLY